MGTEIRTLLTPTGKLNIPYLTSLKNQCFPDTLKTQTLCVVGYLRRKRHNIRAC